MYKVLFVGAFSRELNPIKEEIKKLGLKNIKTSFFTTGIWNYNMILHLSRYLENHELDFVINIWVCWYIDDFIDCIQVGRIKNISNNKELVIPRIIDYGSIQSIACSETIVTDRNVLENEKYVDMESYGFEKVCDSFSIPRMILKLPVDKVGKQTVDFDFEAAEIALRRHIDYKVLLEKITQYVQNHFTIGKWKYQQHYDEFDFYKSHFGFTFSENEIFKRLYFRYISLVNNDFGIYFQSNRVQEKKEFLESLEKYLEKYLVK